MYRYFIIISLLCIHLQSVFAQKDDANNKIQQRYATALRLFNIGNFEEADKELLSISNSSDGMLRSGALRLLALSALERGDEEKAKAYVSTLLKYDPYFTPSIGDSQRFIDIIENSKFHGNTITTASQQAETIEEAPVPVTVISEEMIHNIGARTLKDVLIAYVPGMTDVASNDEMNVAMRSIFSSGQEKVLILLNGHRLNSYSTNAAIPDFSISLEKVKQIEVLRGPASSVYGGVALTSVVNIITKEGGDINGIFVKGGVGNYGQRRGDMLLGRRYLDIDVLVWASIYNAEGEKIFYGIEEQPYSVTPVAGNIIIGGYNRQPSYDIGTTLSWKTLRLMYNRRFSKTVAPYSLSAFFAPYTYANYRDWNGNKPGYAITSNHAEAIYSDKKGKFSWQIAASFDQQDQQRYQVAGDEFPEYMRPYLTIPIVSGTDTIYVSAMNGAFQSVNWSERTVGTHVQLGYSYSMAKDYNGNLIFGGHYYDFNLYSSSYMEGIDYDNAIKTYGPEKQLFTGHETYADIYIQAKQNLGKHLILNAGIRYDYKNRRDNRKMNEFSPRLAFIFNMNKYNIKLSYARSFVDAPYYYRNNNLDINTGYGSMEPEYLKSLQLSFLSDNKLIRNLYLDANIFYNRASNLIVSVFSEIANLNSGKLDTWGAELTMRYKVGRISAEGNLSWQKMISKEGLDDDDHHILNAPGLSSNIILAYSPLPNLTLHTNANIISSQYDYYTSLSDVSLIKVPSRAIFNIGARYKIKKMEISANAYNLFNKKYTQGGNTVVPIQQQGLWYCANISYAF